MSAEPKQADLTDKIISNAGAIAATISAGLYGIGYLVATSYFSSKGISDQTMIAPKYMLTGILMSSIISFFYFYIWRKVPDLASKSYQASHVNNRLSMSLYAIYFLIELLYSICFTALITLTIFGNSQFTQFLVIAAIPFAVDFFFKKIDGYKKSRLICYLASFCLYVLAIYLTFSYGHKSKPIWDLTIQLIGLTFISLMIFYSDSWIKKYDRIYSIFYLVIYTAGVAITFGSSIYEEISPKFGGGAPVRVELKLNKDADLDLIKTLDANKSSTYMISQNDTETTIKIVDDKNGISYIQIKSALINSITSSYEDRSSNIRIKEAEKIRATICEIPYVCSLIKKN